MRIDSSVIAMQSQRAYASYAQHTSASLITSAEDAAILDFSDETKSLIEQMNENKRHLLQQQQRRSQQNYANGFKNIVPDISQERSPNLNELGSLKIAMLRKMLETLRNMRKGKKLPSLEAADKLNPLSNPSLPQANNLQNNSVGITNSDRSAESSLDDSAIAAQSNGNQTLWVKTTVESAFMSETENTADNAQGCVVTSDGRQIGFNVSVEMSRAFSAKYDSLTQEAYVTTDPLIINMDCDTASVTDQKFLFDIDSDGDEESISFAGEGSGFLALDKNKDGKIGDGSELFGTQSGDGFKDLSTYDRDGNGWIDEGDDIFSDLRIWTKDKDGKDHLLTLKEAGVGALCLQNVNTEFSLNDQQTNKTNAILRKSGIYLTEGGEARTMQHVDLAL